MFQPQKKQSLRMAQSKQQSSLQVNLNKRALVDDYNETHSIASNNQIVYLGDNPFNSQHFSQEDIYSSADLSLSKCEGILILQHQSQETENETLHQKCSNLELNQPHCNSKNGVCRSKAHSHFLKPRRPPSSKPKSSIIQQVLLRQAENKAVLGQQVEEKEYIIQIRTSQYITQEQMEQLKKLGQVTMFSESNEGCNAYNKTRPTPKYSQDSAKYSTSRQTESSKVNLKKTMTTQNYELSSPEQFPNKSSKNVNQFEGEIMVKQFRGDTTPSTPKVVGGQNWGITSYRKQSGTTGKKNFYDI